MTKTRTHEEIYANITTATTALADQAGLTGVERRQARAAQCDRLAALWGEASLLADRDRLPATAVLSARLLADRYANDAREFRAERY